VTAKRVLRRADVAAACAAVGVGAPERLRSAADVPELQLPWVAALGVGLLSVEGWNEEAGEPAWITFDQDDIDSRLARLSSDVPETGADLQDARRHGRSSWVT
jgi:hypothetical protein